MSRLCVGEPVPLTRDDMELVFGPAHRAVLKPDALRTHHHRMARLAAAGLRAKEIAERTNYSYGRVCTLLSSPAMVELIAQYSADVHARFLDSTDEYMSQAMENMVRAEDMITDRLNAAEEGEPIALKDLLALTTDRADRFGYPKHSTSTVKKIDFAAALEGANRRSQLARRTEDA